MYHPGGCRKAVNAPAGLSCLDAMRKSIASAKSAKSKGEQAFRCLRFARMALGCSLVDPRFLHLGSHFDRHRLPQGCSAIPISAGERTLAARAQHDAGVFPEK